MKQLLRRLVTTMPVRVATKFVLMAIDLMSRAASVLRTSALFDGPNRPVAHWSVTVKFAKNIRFGSGVVIGPKSSLGAKGGLVLEDHVRISEGVLIETAGLDFRGTPPYPHIARPIHIERGVWIGARAMILAGVRIGQGSIIGAGAIISRDVPARSVVVGQQPDVRSKNDGRTSRAS